MFLQVLARDPRALVDDDVVLAVVVVVLVLAVADRSVLAIFPIRRRTGGGSTILYQKVVGCG